MIRRVSLTAVLVGMMGSSGFAEHTPLVRHAMPDDIFLQTSDQFIQLTAAFQPAPVPPVDPGVPPVPSPPTPPAPVEPAMPMGDSADVGHPTPPVSSVPPIAACPPATPAACATCKTSKKEEGFLSSDERLLEQLGLGGEEFGCFSYSVGGSLRYRYINEHNRLRPPLNGRNTSYDQYRFTPWLELKYDDLITGYVQAIEAPTFNNELPLLPIDENRADLLQYYGDFKVFDFEDGGELRGRVGRQTLLYGSQHLVSPLAWANTFRNFEGYKLYYTSEDWNIDGFATRPVNGASGNFDRPTSYDTPDQSRWFSGVYATYKKAPKGTFDIYWLWLKEDADRLNAIDGNRHTFGARYAGKHPIEDCCGDTQMTLNWDLEGAYQDGTEDFLTGLDQRINAGFLSANCGVTFNEAPWTPTISGIYWYGTGDNDPTDGVSKTVSTLFPLGHAYWGQIDNLSGQNLIDYAIQASVKPTDEVTLLAAWHWFDKAARQDAIYNVAGAPFGGVSTTGSNIGNELDLLATYQVNKNLQLQAGYFWFWYGDAVNANPNALVANRDDAEQFYFMVDWTF